MAAELSYMVPGTPVIHQPYHDLESFFYILVAICLLYDSPHATKPPKKLAECFDTLFIILRAHHSPPRHQEKYKSPILKGPFELPRYLLPRDYKPLQNYIVKVYCD
ncbi:hypothetical protein JVT61DRAFT_13654 [Boletus reticuloceps]|uniref:Uncharacterized protein n=1 Tax=Boletus reticuloceps TaxID=495285 RepID=A0A8I2YD15_9AGAM|nr:hypothetical protein JVT61DRAFT_13654 [Boletus reticuloceps]